MANEMRTIVLDASEFKFPHEFRGEPITGMQEMAGKIYVFTPTSVYIARRVTWLEQLWRKFKSVVQQ